MTHLPVTVVTPIAWRGVPRHLARLSEHRGGCYEGDARGLEVGDLVAPFHVNYGHATVRLTNPGAFGILHC